MAEAEWRLQIVQKIQVLIPDNNELVKICFFLAQQDDASHGHQNSGMWKILKDFAHSDEVFLAFLQKILQEVEMKSQPVRNCIEEVYNEMRLNEKSNYRPFVKLDGKEVKVSGSIGFFYAWSCISPSAQAGILGMIPDDLPSLVGNVSLELITKANDVVNVLGEKSSIVLAAAYLIYDTSHNIYRWWRGEILGKRVAKNMIDFSFIVSTAVAGATAGVAMGGLMGPLGKVVGGVIGSVVYSSAALNVTNRLTEEIFDIPRDETLEKAYDFLGVSQKSSNNEINKAYYRRVLRHHPNKGGSQDTFLKLQNYMVIIRTARGERY